MNGIRKHILPSMKYGALSLIVFFCVNLIGTLAAVIWTDLVFDYSLTFFDQPMYHFAVKETGFQLSGSFVLLAGIFAFGLFVYFFKQKFAK
ncbi:hypothetical protein GLV98_01915 [Halobacillus litoralis]|uniref:Uncharacterized protein n=1 Tax=Halobacillus litoralis TaxID=45668 RepID=A0A845E1Y2_9BACI|nr:hypothetical protein [Halobacillus litoralis]MYL48216.1 hypothetical protein [Halobacillus litoralis]